MPKSVKLNKPEAHNSHGWTLERRKQQAMKIRQWQPWAKSTGAKTPAGKAKSARNAYKGGVRVASRMMMQSIRDALREQKQFLERVK